MSAPVSFSPTNPVRETEIGNSYISVFICQKDNFLSHIMLQVFRNILETGNVVCIQVPVRSAIQA